MSAFETSEGHGGRWQQPVKVPTSKDNIFGAAREMCDDLDAWVVKDVNEETFSITCERKNGMLGGTSTIIVSVAGPDGIPSSTTSVRSESQGALLSRDKANVMEFVKKFTMRVC